MTNLKRRRHGKHNNDFNIHYMKKKKIEAEEIYVPYTVVVKDGVQLVYFNGMPLPHVISTLSEQSASDLLLNGFNGYATIKVRAILLDTKDDTLQD